MITLTNYTMFLCVWGAIYTCTCTCSINMYMYICRTVMEDLLIWLWQDTKTTLISECLKTEGTRWLTYVILGWNGCLPWEVTCTLVYIHVCTCKKLILTHAQRSYLCVFFSEQISVMVTDDWSSNLKNRGSIVVPHKTVAVLLLVRVANLLIEGKLDFRSSPFSKCHELHVQMCMEVSCVQLAAVWNKWAQPKW